MAMAMAMAMGAKLSLSWRFSSKPLAVAPSPYLTFSSSSSSSSSSFSSSFIMQQRPRALASSSSSYLGGNSLRSTMFEIRPLLLRRINVLKVRAGKTSLGCTKRSKSRLSRARTSGFRVRMQTPTGRNVLKRRRAKGRKRLVPATNPSSGKRA
ncbi:hypothetical protein O6H91_Y161700 [Diphasiastrum complanatum]|nr:hypothetical protein O6H91_Y161700 [Diphasiastrum complanatum]